MHNNALTGLIAGVALTAFSAGAQAAIVDKGFPDIQVDFLDVVKSGAQLTISDSVGSSLTFAPDSLTTIGPGDGTSLVDYTLIANFDGAGNFLNGTLDILGSIPGFDGNGTSDLILDATLTGFEQDVNDISFSWQVDAVDTVLGFPLAGGTIVNSLGTAQGIDITSDFAAGFSQNQFDVASDNFGPAEIPAPAPLALMGLGLLALMVQRRRG